MQTVTSREVQSRYGDFVESVQDDVVCVTRHGRPLFWAIADRQVRANDPSVLIGRLLLLNGQLNKSSSPSSGDKFTTFLEQEIDSSTHTEGLSPEDVNTIVHANRR